MNIVKQSVSWEQDPPDGFKILARIERAGRTCYKSEDKITKGSSVKFVNGLIVRGHDSVLEHVSLSVRIICDRGVSHEIVRHRIASYSQESTRYCRYKDEIQVIQPPGLNVKGYLNWKNAMVQCENSYRFMLIQGVSPQIARSVLPTCLKTELVMTANLREWRHFFRLRNALAAHPQMREVAGMILKLFVKSIPVVFDEFMALGPFMFDESKALGKVEKFTA